MELNMSKLLSLIPYSVQKYKLSNLENSKDLFKSLTHLYDKELSKDNNSFVKEFSKEASALKLEVVRKFYSLSVAQFAPLIGISDRSYYRLKYGANYALKFHTGIWLAYISGGFMDIPDLVILCDKYAYLEQMEEIKNIKEKTGLNIGEALLKFYEEKY